MRRAVAAALLVLLLFGVPVYAVEPGEMLPDPAQEARARHLSAELRCLVCQNQSIDESDAQLAKDLRKLLRERIVAGDSDAEIRSFLVARFGDFVLLRPPLDGRTILLWGLPFAALAGGAWIAWRRARRKSAGPASPALDGEERSALDRLLKDHG